MLRSCSINHIIDNINEFQTQLSNPDILDNNKQFVIVIDWKPGKKVLELMINKFGNVSIFIGNKYFNNIVNTCSSMGGKCYHLKTLLPVIKVLNNLLLIDTIPSIYDIFDTRLLPITSSTLIPVYHSEWKHQIEFIVERLCQRNKKNNLLFEINVHNMIEYSPNYKEWVVVDNYLLNLIYYFLSRKNIYIVLLISSKYSNNTEWMKLKFKGLDLKGVKWKN